MKYSFLIWILLAVCGFAYVSIKTLRKPKQEVLTQGCDMSKSDKCEPSTVKCEIDEDIINQYKSWLKKVEDMIKHAAETEIFKQCYIIATKNIPLEEKELYCKVGDYGAVIKRIDMTDLVLFSSTDLRDILYSIYASLDPLSPISLHLPSLERYVYYWDKYPASRYEDIPKMNALMAIEFLSEEDLKTKIITKIEEVLRNHKSKIRNNIFNVYCDILFKSGHKVVIHSEGTAFAGEVLSSSGTEVALKTFNGTYLMVDRNKITGYEDPDGVLVPYIDIVDSWRVQME